MRFLVAFALGLVLLGGVGVCQYTLTRGWDGEIVREVDSHVIDQDFQPYTGLYRVRITPGFDVGRDPFAVRPASESDVARIRVTRDGQELFAWRKDVEKGMAIEICDVRFVGEWAELLVEASPVRDAARVPCALRIEILRGDVVFADQPLWSAGGGMPIQQRIELKLQPAMGKLDRGHGAPAI